MRLIAVSKTFSADEVWPTIALGGQTVFGENRVQEAKAKWLDLRARAAEIGKAVELHLIGPLQSNKAREAVETFDVIQTVDREKIAEALATAMAKTGMRPRLFIEVNTGGEPQKAGVAPEDGRRLHRSVPRDLWPRDRGPDVHPPAQTSRRRRISLCSTSSPGAMGSSELSMGMSADWPLAVQLGATYVRVGSAIFGSRG